MTASVPSTDEMMRRMNIQGMFGGMGGFSEDPIALPPDITRSQYVILRGFRQGCKNSKEVAKSLSMDKKEVDKETSVLISNGYLTKDTKLSSKAMELLGR